jgi:small subunit ribosomal protein S1
VAPISSIPELREQVNRLLIEISRNEDIIVEGRDMSTVVFPHADVKFFLDASVEARARRRSGQGTSELTYEQILSSIRTRDAIDKNKAVGALKVADEAIYLDTSDLTIEQVCEIVVGSIQEHKITFRSIQVVMAENEQKSSKTGNFLQEELQEEYLKSLDELEVGQLVEGTVVAITSEQVFIDVGYKSEGKINLNEFDEKPEIGDTVQVVLVNKEGRHGEVVVSKRKADEKVVWRAIKAAHTDNQPIEGKIARVVKGGFEVDLGGGNRGFNSHLENRSFPGGRT